MDPLSITASCIAVLGALTTSGKGLSKLIALRHSPDELQDLSNEVEGLRLLLTQVQLSLLSIHGSQVHRDNEEILSRMLERMRKPVEDLQTLVEYQVQGIVNDSSPPRLRKREWLRADPKIERHRRRIRDARHDLGLAMTAVNIQLDGRALCQQALQIQSISLVSQEIQDLRSSTHSTGSTVLEENGQRLSQQVNRLYSSLVDLSSGRDNSPGTLSSGPTDSAGVLRIGGPGNSGATVPARLDSQTPLVQVTGTINSQTCPTLCRCRCHSPSHFETPQILKNLLGHLVLSYCGSLRTAPCDYPPCRKRPNKLQFT